MRTLIKLTATLGVLFVLAGCENNAETWAGDVCASLYPWQNDVRQMSKDTSDMLASNDYTPEQIHDALTTLLADAADSTQTALDGVTRAGVPDADGGDEVTSALIDTLETDRDAYQTAHDTIASLDPKSPQFYDGIAEAMEQLNADYVTQPSLTRLASQQLNEAFSNADQCHRE